MFSSFKLSLSSKVGCLWVIKNKCGIEEFLDRWKRYKSVFYLQIKNVRTCDYCTKYKLYLIQMNITNIIYILYIFI